MLKDSDVATEWVKLVSQDVKRIGVLEPELFMIEFLDDQFRLPDGSTNLYLDYKIEILLNRWKCMRVTELYKASTVLERNYQNLANLMNFRSFERILFQLKSRPFSRFRPFSTQYIWAKFFRTEFFGTILELICS